MKEKDTDSNQRERTKRLAEELGKHPHLRDQVEAIVNLVRGDDGPIGKADDIEARLVTEVRKLGKKAMQEWARHAEERSAAELQRASPTARCWKKKS